VAKEGEKLGSKLYEVKMRNRYEKLKKKTQSKYVVKMIPVSANGK
jgi:hypothetical protein